MPEAAINTNVKHAFFIKKFYTIVFFLKIPIVISFVLPTVPTV